MEKFFEIGGTVVRVTGREQDLFEQNGILRGFETDGPRWDRQITCCIRDTLPPPAGVCVFSASGRRVYQADGAYISYIGTVSDSWEGAYIRVERRGRESRMEVKRSALPGRIPAKTVLAGLEVEHLVVEDGGFLLHASCICRNGRAIAFTAPSGTGKSTQAALWEQLRGAEIINGDRIVVRRSGQGFEALGIPYSGSSGIRKNRRMPLEAIVCLSQAAQTEIRPLTGVQAFRRIWEGCSLHAWNRADVDACLETVRRAVGGVAVYHLTCTPDESAVVALETILESR